MRLPTLFLLALSVAATQAYATSILGTADSFAVLGNTTVTNTGSTIIDGDLGVYPGTSITGTGSISLSGTLHDGDSVAQQAQSDAAAAYGLLAAMTPTQDLSGEDLGGMTLTPGVYKFSTSAQLTGTLTLNAEGNDDALWVFLIGSTLMTASTSDVTFINQGSTPNDGLFWDVGSSATLGSSSAFAGNILASSAITFDASATIDCGRAVAQNGAVTLSANTVSASCQGTGLETSDGLSGGGSTIPSSPIPEPGSIALFGTGLLALAGVARRSLVNRPVRGKD